MYCELKNRDVDISVVKEGKVGNKVIQFKDCSGNYKELGWGTVRLQCEMATHEGCLLKK